MVLCFCQPLLVTGHEELFDAAAQIRGMTKLREYVDSRLAWYPLEGVIPSAWENFVTENDSAGEERVNRLTYELGVLQTLRERVRSKEIWVAGERRPRRVPPTPRSSTPSIRTY